MEGWQGDGNATCWESCGAGGNGVWLGRCPTTGRLCPGYGDVQLLGAAPEVSPRSMRGNGGRAAWLQPDLTL